MTAMRGPVAVIAMSGRFPDAPTMAAFRANLRAGRDSVTGPSPARARATGFDPSRAYVPFAEIDGIERFDHAFFGLSRAEATTMDPHARLLIEVAHRCLENSGRPPSSHRGSRTGVYLGEPVLTYAAFARQDDPTLLTGVMNAALAGRLARIFDLRGPALMVDTACSSSLVAVHLACQALALGEVDQMLVGAANLYPAPHPREGGLDLGILSPAGKARAFAAGADGTSNGEAVVCVLLKPLEAALRDGDPVEAVILGSAVNQDAARSASLTAPNVEAQAAVLTAAWACAGIEAGSIGLIEAHGTGTRLGDPIEADGIGAAFRAAGGRSRDCALSALKSTVGHSDAAAGLSSLAKAVLAVREGEIYPVAHFDGPNPLIDFAAARIRVPVQCESWTGSPRRCGVSSFGLSGTNVHVVVEQAPGADRGNASPTPALPELIVLSGRDAPGLRRAVAALEAEVRTRDLSLADVSRTLVGGRDHHEHRFAGCAATRQDLLALLAAPPTASVPIDAMWLAFSDDAVGPWAALAETEADFARHWRAAGGGPGVDDVLAAQVALYRTLVGRGLPPPNVIGTGRGKLSIDVISGRASLEEARARRASGDVEAPPSDLSRRLDGFLREKVAGRTVLVAEMGADGALLRTLASRGGEPAAMPAVDAAAGLVPLLATLYRGCWALDWRRARGERAGWPVELPGYPFAPTRCWLKEPWTLAEADVGALLHELAWMPTDEDGEGQLPARMFVLGGRVGRGADLARSLEARGTALVHPPDGFDAGRASDWDRLDAVDVDGFLDLRGLAPAEAPPDAYVFGQFLAARHFAPRLGSGFAVLVAVAHAAAIDGADRVCPERTAALAFLRSLLVDHPGLTLRVVDVASDPDLDAAAQALGRPRGPCFAALRGGRIHAPALVPPAPMTPTRPPRAGVFLLVGGAGGIGVRLGRHLAEATGGHVYATGRRAAATVPELPPAGGPVTYRAVDAGDRGAMRLLVDEILARHGRLDGIVHLAGVPGRWVPLGAKDPHDFAATLAPKRDGALAVAEAARRTRPDFVVFFSSLNALLPQRHSGDYAAANGFLDGLARSLAAEGIPAVAIGWPGWSGTGMRVRSEAAAGPKSATLREVTVDEGLRIFDRALGAGRPNLVVAELDPRRFGSNPFFHLGGVPVPTAPAQDADGAGRALLGPAATGAEARVAGVWQEVLGLDALARDDDFFLLGGHSLNGAQVAHRLGALFGARVTVEDVLARPVLRDLAAHLAARSAGPAPSGRLAPMPIPEAADYPASVAQTRMWLLAALDGASRAYAMPVGLLIDGALDAAALEGAVLHVVGRHESLRTVFALRDGALRQRVLPGLDPSWIRREDLAGEDDPLAAARAAAEAEADKPFDLERGPLLRMALLRLGPHRHALLLTTHHMVSDGWSAAVLVREVHEVYAALAAGRTPALPRPALQYRDFAAWQHDLLAGPDLAESRAYWLAKLEGEPAPLDLPTDLPRPQVQSSAAAVHAFALAPVEVAALADLARARGASLFMALVALIKLLLHRYTGSDDIVVGTVAAGRRHPALEDGIGLYLDTLALRDAVDAEGSFLALLDDVRATVAGALDHALYPFDWLVGDLALPRDLGRSPLFDVMVMLQNTADATLRLPGLDCRPLGAEPAAAKCDLTFDCREWDGGLSIAVEYRTDLFRPARMVRLEGHLRTLLAGVLADPGRALGRLPLLTAGERRDAEARFVNAAVIAATTVPALVAAQALRRPEAPAVSAEDGMLTYAELQRRVDALARALRARGAGPEVRVAVCVRRALALPVALLAVLRAGAAYVPLDPDQPPERLSAMLADAGAALVLHDGSLPGGLDLGAARAVTLAIAGEAEAAAELPYPEPSHLAYVLFTSGSTGRPKGVEVEHRSLSNLLGSMRSTPGIAAGDVLLAVTTVGFDIAGLEIFLPLVAGARLVVAPAEAARDGALLAGALRRCGATVLQGTPATWRQLLAAGWVGEPRLVALCGGEALPTGLARALLPRVGALWNLYGPTETTIWSSLRRVDAAALDEGWPSVPLGTPVAGTVLRLLDAAGEPVPDGTVGELSIGGVGVARGYAGLSDLSRERFVDRPGIGRMYRTGDLARVDGAGEIHFLGRSDHQLKVRGFRIEAGEVEAALARLPDVVEARALAVADPDGAADLVAYAVLRPGAASDPAALRRGLVGFLPAPMVPSAVVLLDALPLTAAGKLDRARLPRPAPAVPAGREPAGALEIVVADLWCDVLRLDRVPADADFFDLGGHSLRAMQLSAALAGRGLAVSLLDVFRHPTVAAQAELLAGRAAALPGAAAASAWAGVAMATADELEALDD